ncbi:cytochrome P450 family protein [Actinokineospora fastidiosa]|uniref:Cytochrome P450 hydroxylase n=1 Tax=Actinokineospora fastidiosa TaxID=1816 RepID=A0A918GF64_9PSEU|nr:cytochrome P450 [Actinokineospora fastidiosa]GGS29464.1 cytochrome P450 hydroxylase [Actinokineospora fastidiosa]
MTTQLASTTVDLTAEDFHATAHPLYDALRARDPVSFVRLPHQPEGEGFWMITGHAAAEAALRHRGLANDPRRALSPEEIARRPETRHPGTQATMLFTDPPEHTRLRRVLTKAFTPRLVARLRPAMAGHADRLLASAARSDEVDLISAYAYPLPLAVIGDVLGYPESWHDRLRDFAVRAAARSSPLDAPDGDVGAELEGYARDVVALKRREPGDDLVSRLLNPDSADDRLTDTELLAMIGLLTAAGFETTASVIGCAALALAGHPDQWAALRRDPGLASAAVEETLRHWCPIETATMRFAVAPLDIAGRRIGAGDTVLVFPGAANRDPDHVPDPHRFDIHREPRGHLGFGGGIHTCPGAALARAECRTAIAMLASRWPDLRLACSPEEPRWRPGMGLRGLRELPVHPGVPR